MCRQAMALFQHLNPTTEKLEVLSRLSPCLDSDEETAYTLSVLMSIIGDYTQRLRESLNTLVAPDGGEEVGP